MNSTLRDLNLNLAAEDGVQGVDWPEDPGQETSPLDELREWYEGLNPRPSGIDFDLIREGGFGGSPNLKDGALLKNIENVYVVRDSDVVRRFVQFAEDSWSKALPDLEMPIVDSNQFR